MLLSVQTNIVAVLAQRRLGRSNGELSRSFHRLASAMRPDDAVVEEIQSEEGLLAALPIGIRFKNQALCDVNDGLSMTQVAEDALTRSIDILYSLRSLLFNNKDSLDSSSESDPESEQPRTDSLISLIAELDRIFREASFNGRNLMKDGFQGVLLQTGIGQKGDAVIPVVIGRIDIAELGLHAVNLEEDNQEIDHLIAKVDQILHKISDVRHNVQTMHGRFTQAVFNFATVTENVAAARSNNHDAESVARTSNAILSQVGMAIQTQANQPADLVRHLLG